MLCLHLHLLHPKKRNYITLKTYHIRGPNIYIAKYVCLLHRGFHTPHILTTSSVCCQCSYHISNGSQEIHPDYPLWTPQIYPRHPKESLAVENTGSVRQDSDTGNKPGVPSGWKCCRACAGQETGGIKRPPEASIYGFFNYCL